MKMMKAMTMKKMMPSDESPCSARVLPVPVYSPWVALIIPVTALVRPVA